MRSARWAGLSPRLRRLDDRPAGPTRRPGSRTRHDTVTVAVSLALPRSWHAAYTSVLPKQNVAGSSPVSRSTSHVSCLARHPTLEAVPRSSRSRSASQTSTGMNTDFLCICPCLNPSHSGTDPRRGPRNSSVALVRQSAWTRTSPRARRPYPEGLRHDGCSDPADQSRGTLRTAPQTLRTVAPPHAPPTTLGLRSTMEPHGHPAMREPGRPKGGRREQAAPVSRARARVHHQPDQPA